MRILFNSRQEKFKTPFGVLTPEEVCVLRLLLPAELETSAVQLVLEREDGTPYTRVALAPDGSEGAYERYRAALTLPECGLFFYWFSITAKTGPFRLFRQGDETNMELGEKWQLSCVPAEYSVPDWAKGAVIYQIFPDRFYKSGCCDLTGKLRPYVLRDDWGAQPQWEPDAHGEVLCNDFFGGNFRGIAEKLDELRTRGVGIVYLNPISYAFSNHRYDTADYKKPDPLLGTLDDFRALCDKAHRLGMRVILDGVFSHTGSNSTYFDRLGLFENGACRGESSPYYKWYRFHRFPDEYECWWNFPTLPCLNKAEPSLVDFLIDADDSVIAHWLRCGADGFRLDVVDELPDEFVQRLKKRLRELKPDALLLGEVWEDASNKISYGCRRRYFTAAELDSVMNYPWKNTVLAFVKGTDDGTALAESIMTLAENYPPQVLQCTMNLLGSHDTARVLTVLGHDFDGTRRQQAAHRLTADEREKGKRLLRLAAFLQYILPGCPSIYYGDEAGMEGCKDPFNRACYPWGQEDTELVEFFRQLGRLKAEQPALRSAFVRVRAAGNGRIALERGGGIVAYGNRGENPWEDIPAAGLLYGVGVQRTQSDRLQLASGGFALVRE